jgi:hypothetical protein
MNSANLPDLLPHQVLVTLVALFSLNAYIYWIWHLNTPRENRTHNLLIKSQLL